MSRALFILSLLRCWLFAATGVVATGAGAAETLSGRVVGVHDGDTLTVLIGELPLKVRLQGIDAPELAQSHGQQAKQAMSVLVFGREVVLEIIDTDRYRRKVARVRIEGRDVGLTMVRAGHAWWYQKYAPGDDALGRLEADARTHHRGLWRDSAPVAPWDWRRASVRSAAHRPR